jgi:hypothetical protein
MKLQLSFNLKNFLIFINFIIILSLIFLFYFITTNLVNDLENYTFNFFQSISKYISSRFKNYIQYKQYGALEIVIKQELGTNKLDENLVSIYFFDDQKK